MLYPIVHSIRIGARNLNEVDKTTRLYEPEGLFEGRATYSFQHISEPSRSRVGSCKKGDLARIKAFGTNGEHIISLDLLGVYFSKGKELKNVYHNGQEVKRASLFRLVCPQYSQIHGQVVECEPDMFFNQK